MTNKELCEGLLLAVMNSHNMGVYYDLQWYYDKNWLTTNYDDMVEELIAIVSRMNRDW